MEKNFGIEKTTGERNIGIDLLRIVATLMIVVFHVLHGNFISQTSLSYLWGEAFLLGCFNLIALIAGFVFFGGKFRLGRVIRLWVMGIFYSVVFYLVTAAVTGSFHWVVLFKSFFPVTRWRIWFFSLYILLLFLMPIFNYAIEKLNRKVYLAGLIFFAVFFSVIEFTADPWGIAGGKSALWLAYLYFVGAYCKKYGFCIKKWWINLLIYIGCSLATVGLVMLSGKITVWFWEARYAEYLHQYCCIFALIGSVALFSLFAQLPIKRSAERTMHYFSSHGFGIYLAHSFIIGYWLVFATRYHWGTGSNALDVILCTIASFGISFIIEAIRRLLFRVSRIDALTERLGDKIQKKLESKEENND